jgi:hypothetical protein
LQWHFQRLLSNVFAHFSFNFIKLYCKIKGYNSYFYITLGPSDWVLTLSAVWNKSKAISFKFKTSPEYMYLKSSCIVWKSVSLMTTRLLVDSVISWENIALKTVDWPETEHSKETFSQILKIWWWNSLFASSKFKIIFTKIYSLKFLKLIIRYIKFFNKVWKSRRFFTLINISDTSISQSFFLIFLFAICVLILY